VRAHRDDIAVIGSGAVGLVTAVELLSRGKPVTVYARNLDAPPASSAAPAMFTPFRGTDGSDFERRTRVAMDKLSLIARTESDSGVALGTLREYFYHEPPKDPWMASLLRMSPLATRPPLPRDHRFGPPCDRHAAVLAVAAAAGSFDGRLTDRKDRDEP
jgi:hypothetical protein